MQNKERRYRWLTGLVRSCVCTAIALTLTVPALAANQIPKYINFQGQLTDSSGAKLNGNRSVTFAIYNVATGGSPLYSEAQTLTLSNGVGSALIGSVTALTLPFDTQYYLGVTISGDAEMTPRVQLSATAYAFTAQELADSAKAQGSLLVAETLTVVGRGHFSDTLSVDSVIYAFRYYGDGSQLTGISGGGSDTDWTLGAGETIYRATGNVGIGTSTPTRVLHVSSASQAVARIQSSNTKSGIEFSDAGTTLPPSIASNGNSLSLQTGLIGQQRLTVEAAGNVGIGTASPSDSLHVVGTVKIGDSLAVADTVLVVDHVTGRVGIGVANPTVSVDIVGGILATGTASTDGLTMQNGNINVYIQSKATAATTNAYIVADGGSSTGSSYFGMRRGGAQKWGIGMTGSDELFRIANTELNSVSEAQTKFTINRTSGNVGIATSTPSDSLHVNGTVRIGDSLTVADTVFVVDHVVGKVGIGVADPTSPLTIGGSAVIRQTANSLTNGYSSYAVGGVADGYITVSILGTDLGAIQVADDGQWRDLTLQPNGGKVGVGTSSPLSVLHAAGSDVEFRLQNTDAGGDTWKFIVGDNATGPVGGLFIQNPEHPTSNVLKISPAGALEVQGSVKARDSMQVGTGAGADSLNVYGRVHFSDTLSVDSVIYASRYYGDGSQLTGITASAGPDTDWTVDGSGNVVRTTGNVGIGTASPSEKLEIANAGLFNVDFDNTSNGVGARIQTGTSGVFFGSRTAHTFHLGTAVSSQMQIDTNGDVGIGGPAGSAKLYVGGNVGIGTTSPSDSLAVTGGVHISDTLSVDSVIYASRYYGDGSQLTGISASAAADTDWTIGDSSLSVLARNVGIGIAGPSDSLHVTGTVYFGETATVKDTFRAGWIGIGASSQQDALEFGPSAYTGNIDAKIGFRFNSTEYFVIDHNRSGANAVNFVMGPDNTTSAMYFKFREVGTTKDVLKLQAEGSAFFDTVTLVVDGTNDRVGVGTNSPAKDFHVVGEARVDTALYLGGGVGTMFGADNLIKTGAASAFLNIKGGSGRAKMMLADDSVVIVAGNNASSGNIEFRADATSATDPGVAQMVIRRGGVIGIGTSTPLDSLTISGGGLHVSDTISADSAISAAFFRGDGSELTNLPASSAQPDTDWTVDSSGNVVRTTGKVGIGTASPSDSLHVLGTVQVSDSMRVGDTTFYVSKIQGAVGVGTLQPNQNITDGNYNYPGSVPSIHAKGDQPRLIAEGSQSAALDLIHTGATNNEEWMQLANVSSYTKFRVINNSGGIARDNVITIDHTNGNIGIGQATPSERLHMQGRIRSDSGLYVGNGVGTMFGDDNLIKTSSASAFLNIKGGTGRAKMMLADDSVVVVAGNNASGNIEFRTDGTSTTDPGVRRMTIQRGGLIGIGTGAPTDSLSIVGGGLHVSDTIAADSTITAAFFRGDGSQLTGVAAGSLSPANLTSDILNDSIGFAAVDDNQLDSTIKVRDSFQVGIDSFIVNSSGVGIGTNAPTEELSVVSAADAGLYYRRNGSNYVGFKYAAGIANLQTDAANLALWSQSGERVRIDSAGKVGIGTANPSDSLHVAGTVKISDSLVVSDTVFVVDHVTGGVGVGTTSPTNALEVVGATQILQRHNASGQGFYFGQYNGTGDVSLNNNANATLTFSTNNTERMRIAGDGKIGIGTASSADSLHVAGTAKIADSLVVSDTVLVVDHVHSNVGIGTDSPNQDLHLKRLTPVFQLESMNGNASSQIEFKRNADNNSIAQMKIGGGGGHGGISFQNRPFSSDVAPIERMFIHESGKIGIGTQSPSDSLHIAGSFRVQDTILVNSTSAGWNTANAAMFVGSDAGRSINAAGSVNASGADYAEYLEKANHAEFFERGSIVAVRSGKISSAPDGADFFAVVSTEPGFIGNDKLLVNHLQPDQVEKIVFMGQAPVKVAGKVNAGDFIVYSAKDYGKAIAQKDMTFELYRSAVGMALMGSGELGIKKISAMIVINSGASEKNLKLASGAHVSEGGVWTNASSRAYKHDIRALGNEDYNKELERLDDIEVVKFRYNAEASADYAGKQRLGIIAEDAPDEITTADKKGMPTGDAIGYLLAVVKALRAQNQDSSEKYEAVLHQNQMLLERLMAIEKKLEAR